MSVERKAALVLGFFLLAEGSWTVVNLYFNGWRLVRYLGFAPGHAGSLAGWIAAALTVVIFVGHSIRLPSVRANLLRPSALKLLALGMAVAVGILEEVVFRRYVMDATRDAGGGAVLQVLASGLVFGVVHAIWGLMGRSLRAAAGAMIATTTLGLMLGVVYLLAGRSLAPCIAAHFLIDAFIEPGLILAAMRGEMARPTGTPR